LTFVLITAGDECKIDDDCPKTGNLFYIYKCIDQKCELAAAHL